MRVDTRREAGVYREQQAHSCCSIDTTTVWRHYRRDSRQDYNPSQHALRQSNKTTRISREEEGAKREGEVVFPIHTFVNFVLSART